MRFGVHAKVGIGWALCTLGGISLFYFSRTSVDKRRYEDMKIRQRIKKSNEGEYQPSDRKFYKSSD